MAVQSGNIDADLMVIGKAVAGARVCHSMQGQSAGQSVIDALTNRPNSNMANDVGKAITKYAQHF